MSQQQMNFDENNRQQQEPQYGAGYGDPFTGSSERQKLSSQTFESHRGNPTNMRLALAIVSVCILIPISAITLTMGDSPFALFKGLIGLGIVCLTIMVVNIVFNFKR